MCTAGTFQIPHSEKHSHSHSKLVPIWDLEGTASCSSRRTRSRSKTILRRDFVALIQQSICAIEFIGETLQAGTVQSIRAARDELLVPTEKGRAWIELVSSVEVELLGIVLSDKGLTKRAVTLLRRAQKLVAKRDKATVSAGDVEDGIAFLESLGSRATSPEAHKAISIISGQLKKAGGQTVEATLIKLAKSNPRRRD